MSTKFSDIYTARAVHATRDSLQSFYASCRHVFDLTRLSLDFPPTAKPAYRYSPPRALHAERSAGLAAKCHPPPLSSPQDRSSRCGRLLHQEVEGCRYPDPPNVEREWEGEFSMETLRLHRFFFGL